MALRFSRIRPLRQDADVVLRIAVRERGFGDADAACCSSVVLDHHGR